MSSDNIPFYDIIDALNKVCKSKVGLSISSEHEKEALLQARIHILEHNNEFSIQPKTLDVYKLISWYGYFLSHSTYDPKRIIYLMTIQVLNEILSKEVCNKSFSKEFISKLYHMLSRDSQSGDFSIGKNGLYVAFRSAKDICRQCN